MHGQLRNEDYVAFLDESGNDDLKIVAGVLIPARWMRSTESRWDHFVRDRGLQGQGELKAWKLVSGRGLARILGERVPRPAGLSKRDHYAACGRQAYVDVLRLIGSLTEVRVAVVGVPSAQALDAYRLWYWMACAGLTTRPRSPRPRLPVIVIDGQDQGIRRAHRGVTGDFYWRCRGRQPYVAGGRPWFMGGAVLQDSVALPFMQMADLVAYAAFQAIDKAASRAFMHSWYEEHLLGAAAAKRRPIDVSRHFLEELLQLDPAHDGRLRHRDALLAA